MRTARLAAALLAALVAAGCARGAPPLDARLADRLLVEARTPEERALRLCLVGAAASELAADRVVRFDPADAPAVAAVIDGLERRLRALAEEGGGIWLDTGLFEAKRLLVAAAGRRLRGRVLQVLAAGGPGAGDALRAAGALGKAEAMAADIARALGRLRAGELAPGRLWRACFARIARNRARVAPLVGA